MYRIVSSSFAVFHRSGVGRTGFMQMNKVQEFSCTGSPIRRRLSFSVLYRRRHACLLLPEGGMYMEVISIVISVLSLTISAIALGLQLSQYKLTENDRSASHR